MPNESWRTVTGQLPVRAVASVEAGVVPFVITAHRNRQLGPSKGKATSTSTCYLCFPPFVPQKKNKTWGDQDSKITGHKQSVKSLVKGRKTKILVCFTTWNSLLSGYKNMHLFLKRYFFCFVREASVWMVQIILNNCRSFDNKHCQKRVLIFAFLGILLHTAEEKSRRHRAWHVRDKYLTGNKHLKTHEK